MKISQIRINVTTLSGLILFWCNIVTLFKKWLYSYDFTVMMFHGYKGDIFMVPEGYRALVNFINVNVQFFCTNVRFGSFYYIHVTRKSCWNDVCMKNAWVLRWWNWQQGSISSTFYAHIYSTKVLFCQNLSREKLCEAISYDKGAHKTNVDEIDTW